MRHSVLLFSDLHLNTWSFGSSRDRKGRNTRLSDGLSILGEVYHLAHCKSIPYVIFPGDLFHTRNSVASEVLSRTAATLQNLSRKYPDITLYLLLGNHDWTRDMSYSSVMVLGLVPRVKVISRPKKISLFGGEINALFVPYTPHPEKFKSALQDSSDIDVVFAHQGFSGLATDPRNYHIDEIASVSSVFGWAGKPKVDLISGHYHDWSLLTPPKSSMFGFFVGAANQQNFGDVGCDRGYITYQLGSQNPVFHSLLSNRPQFLDVDESTEVSEDFVKGNFIRLHTSDELMGQLEDHIQSFHPLKTFRKHRSSEQIDLTLTPRIENMTPLQTIKQYVRERAGKLSREDLMEYFEAKV